MKRILIYFGWLLLLGCDFEDAPDCLQAAGHLETQTVSVPAFSKIIVEEHITLVLSEGDDQQVTIETGGNLIDDISVRVENETLILVDSNNCNLVRDYGITVAYVTTPQLTEIRNSSSFDVRGEGVLTFPQLRLVSNSTVGPSEVRKGGDFYLDIKCERLVVEANGQSVFYIAGTTEEAILSFTDEFPRFEGANLKIGALSVFQRSANKMIVHPIEEIVGEIRGTGDVVSIHRPPRVAVEEFFTGRLVFQD
jgi:hypothetical protein